MGPGHLSLACWSYRLRVNFLSSLRHSGLVSSNCVCMFFKIPVPVHLELFHSAPLRTFKFNQVSILLALLSKPYIHHLEATPMQLKIVFILASASLGMSAVITGFAGADCTGTQGESSTLSTPGVCFTLGGDSTKSISYSGVPDQIQFFVSVGDHDSCFIGPPQLTLGSGSGCGTAPAG